MKLLIPSLVVIFLISPVVGNAQSKGRYLDLREETSDTPLTDAAALALEKACGPELNSNVQIKCDKIARQHNPEFSTGWLKAACECMKQHLAELSPLCPPGSMGIVGLAASIEQSCKG